MAATAEPNEVWVVSQGEDHEGSHILGIYSTKYKAISWVVNYLSNDYRRGNKFSFDEPSLTWSLRCDFISVDQYDVY